MPRQSKIDATECSDDVLRLAREGKTPEYISSWLWEIKRLKISKTCVVQHLEKHGVNIPTGKNAKLKNDSDTDSDSDTDDNDGVYIDIAQYKKLWDIPEKLDSPEKIITVVQKATAEIHLLNCILVHAGLTANMNGLDRYPKQKINGLKLTHDVMSQSWGLTQTIDLNAALSTLEKHGELQSIRLIETDTDES